AAFELAGVHNLQSQDSQRVGIERVERHRAFGRRAEGGEILPEKMRLRQRDHRKLVRSIHLYTTPGCGQGSFERSFVSAEAKGVFVNQALRQAGPEVRRLIV